MATQTKTVVALQSFIAKRKFLAEGFYPGAPNEMLRARLEVQINSLAQDLIARHPETLSKTDVLSAFEGTLAQVTASDTEERERVCGYLEEIMDIYGIESSDGLLNTWLYGFDPAKVKRQPSPSGT